MTSLVSLLGHNAVSAESEGFLVSLRTRSASKFIYPKNAFLYRNEPKFLVSSDIRELKFQPDFMGLLFKEDCHLQIKKLFLSF
jgi:hypothetical protein